MPNPTTDLCAEPIDDPDRCNLGDECLRAFRISPDVHNRLSGLEYADDLGLGSVLDVLEHLGGVPITISTAHLGFARFDFADFVSAHAWRDEPAMRRMAAFVRREMVDRQETGRQIALLMEVTAHAAASILHDNGQTTTSRRCETMDGEDLGRRLDEIESTISEANDQLSECLELAKARRAHDNC